MPVYQLGDLVRWRGVGPIEDLNTLGLILEMRSMPHGRADARVLWHDMPNPSWALLSDLVPMEPVQPEQPVVE